MTSDALLFFRSFYTIGIHDVLDNVMLIDMYNLWGSLIVIIECMYIHDVLMDYTGNACANRVQDNEFAV